MVVETCHFASAPPQTSSAVLKGASPAPAFPLPLHLDLTLNLCLDHLTSYSERRYSFNFIPGMVAPRRKKRLLLRPAPQNTIAAQPRLWKCSKLRGVCGAK